MIYKGENPLRRARKVVFGRIDDFYEPQEVAPFLADIYADPLRYLPFFEEGNTPPESIDRLVALAHTR